MAREANKAGHSMSMQKLLDTLAGIQETVLLYQAERGRPRLLRMLSEIDPLSASSTTVSVSMPTPQSDDLGTT